jgi:hypothetical protein
MHLSAKKHFWIWLIGSLALAYGGVRYPSHQMPIDYSAIPTVCVPLAAIWAVVLGFAIWRYKLRGLWLLMGAPMALYWPIWWLLNFRNLPCSPTHLCL